MSYTGLGQFSIGAPSLNLSVKQPSMTAPAPAASVDPAIVTGLATFLSSLSGTMGDGDSNKKVIFLSSAALQNLKPGANGKVDGAAVIRALNIMPTALQSWVSKVLGMTPQTLSGQAYAAFVATLQGMHVTSLATLLAGIPSGQYATVGATAQPLQLLYRPTLATASKLAVPMLTAKTTDVPKPQNDKLCADGYYRDASGMCVAQPVAPAQATPPAITQAPPAEQMQVPSFDAMTTDVNTLSPADLTVPAAEATPVPATGAAAGFPWLYVGIGAAGLAAVGLVMMSRRRSTPNRRRSAKNKRGKRTRRHSRRV